MNITMNKTELYGAITDAVEKWNTAVLTDDAIGASAIDKDINKYVQEYKELCANECYNELLGKEDPLKEAVLKFDYDSIKVKQKKLGELGVEQREVQPTKEYIDPLILQSKAGKPLGRGDKNWAYLCQKMNFLMTIDCAGGVSSNAELVEAIGKEFDISSVARALDIGDNADPCSATQMLKTLTRIVQGMVGEEYKPTSHDVRFLKEVWGSFDRKNPLCVKASTNKLFVHKVFTICHRIVTQKEFGVTYKKAK